MSKLNTRVLSRNWNRAASSNWQVIWWVRKLPDSIKAEAGNPDLVIS